MPAIWPLSAWTAFTFWPAAPADSPAVALADAIATALNGAGLSEAVTFSRVYVPKFDLKDAATIQGRVVPVGDARQMGSAADDDGTFQIDVAVMKRLANLEPNSAAQLAEIDGLLELCEQIRAVLNRQRLADAPEAVCTGIAQEPIYGVTEMDQDQIFLTVLRATFLMEVSV